MPPPVAAWHDYFMMLGTASATLLGAMFVVVSLGIGFLTRERSAGTRTFLTGTVTNLSAVLFAAALMMVPDLDWLWFGAIVAAIGLAGLVHSLRALFGFRQHAYVEPSDWFWYAIAPVIAYLLFVAAAAAALRAMPLGLYLFALAAAFLLIAGIRNAWDMIVFLVTQPRDAE